MLLLNVIVSASSPVDTSKVVLLLALVKSFKIIVSSPPLLLIVRSTSVPFCKVIMSLLSPVVIETTPLMLDKSITSSWSVPLPVALLIVRDSRVVVFNCEISSAPVPVLMINPSRSENSMLNSSGSRVPPVPRFKLMATSPPLFKPKPSLEATYSASPWAISLLELSRPVRLLMICRNVSSPVVTSREKTARLDCSALLTYTSSPAEVWAMPILLAPARPLTPSSPSSSD